MAYVLKNKLAKDPLPRKRQVWLKEIKDHVNNGGRYIMFRDYKDKNSSSKWSIVPTQSLTELQQVFVCGNWH